MTADVIALWPALAVLWLVFGLFGVIAHTAERRQQAKRRHPSSRGRHR